MIACKNCLASHQLDAVILTYVRAVLNRPYKFRLAEAAQVGRDLIFAHTVRTFPLLGVQIQFTTTVHRAMIPESLKFAIKLKYCVKKVKIRIVPENCQRQIRRS